MDMHINIYHEIKISKSIKDAHVVLELDDRNEIQNLEVKSVKTELRPLWYSRLLLAG